jgi:hypothetical protein
MDDPGHGPQPARSSRSRPSRPLPTNRIAFPKQMELLRAYAALSGPQSRPVGNKALAGIVKLAADTVSLVNPFLADSFLLIKIDNGYAPTDDVQSFAKAYDWSPDSAAERLAPTLSRTWFWEVLQPRLQMRAISEKDAIQALAESVGASREYEPQLGTILDYLAAAGMVERDGGMVRRRSKAPSESQAPDEAPADQGREQQPAREAPRSTVFVSSAAQPTQGVIAFDISVRVSMAEMSGWSSDRIAAFFGGVAQVLAAKGRAEEEPAKTD